MPERDIGSLRMMGWGLLVVESSSVVVAAVVVAAVVVAPRGGGGEKEFKGFYGKVPINCFFMIGHQNRDLDVILPGN